MCSEDALWSIKGKHETSQCGGAEQLDCYFIHAIFRVNSFQKSNLFVVGKHTTHFQTQTDSSEAVIRASSLPLVMNPTRAEVMRETREREGVAGMKTASGERRQTYCMHFLLIFTQISEIV